MDSNDKKLNKINTILIFSIYIFAILFTLMYLLWTYYGSQVYQCTVTDNPYCQRLKCDKYDITKELSINSQPDPQNQYMLSMFYTISMQSESADPTNNGFPGGYCADNPNANGCYDPEAVLPGASKDDSSNFKKLAINVIHNNLLRQTKFMCKEIFDKGSDNPDIVNICEESFELENGSRNYEKSTLPFLNKKLLENLAIMTNFSYYKFTKAETINDGIRELRDIMEIRTCVEKPCSQVYVNPINNEFITNVKYGPEGINLKADDPCSKCQENSNPNQYKLFLPRLGGSTNENIVNYKLYNINQNMNEL